MRQKRVLAIGELLMDDYGDCCHPGGAPANFAAHLVRFGVPASLYSAVGDDRHGDELLKFLRHWNVDTSMIDCIGFPSGRVLVTLKNGQPDYEILENVAWDNLKYHDIPAFDAVYFGSLAQRFETSREVIRRIVEKAGNALRIFDVNLRQNYFDRDVLEWSLMHTNLLKLNDEELPVVAEMFDLSSQNESFLKQVSRKFNIGIVVLTLGKEGSMVYSDDEIHREPAYPCNMKNPVGAGDAFTAAFAAGILNGENISESQRVANRAAALVCEHESAIPELLKNMTLCGNS